MIDEFDQNVHFLEIDIEEDPEIAEAAGIMGTPCVQFFKNKELLRLDNGSYYLLSQLAHIHWIYPCMKFMLTTHGDVPFGFIRGVILV